MLVVLCLPNSSRIVDVSRVDYGAPHSHTGAAETLAASAARNTFKDQLLSSDLEISSGFPSPM